MSVSEEVRRALRQQQKRLQRESEMKQLRDKISELESRLAPPGDPQPEPTPPPPQPEPLLIDTEPEPVNEPKNLLERLRGRGRKAKETRRNKSRPPEVEKEEKAESE
jgi:hypothetical protein